MRQIVESIHFTEHEQGYNAELFFAALLARLGKQMVYFYMSKNMMTKPAMQTETVYGNIYDHPNLYDVLFSDTCGREVDFLLDCLQRFGTGKMLKRCRFFEPACGTGRLLWRLAKLGHDAVGLDLNSKAVAFCNRRLRRHRLPETAVIGDMTEFTLKELKRKRPFDMAFNFVSSFLHLTSETAALQHLEAVADALKPGGCYLLGLHLHPRGEAHCSQETWSVRRGSLAIRSHLGRTDIDRRNRLETVRFRIEATTPKRRYEVVDSFPLRVYTLEQFRALLKKSNRFETFETYDFDLDLPIRVDTKTEDVVYVLRKK